MLNSKKRYNPFEKLHIKHWFWKRFLKIFFISLSNRIILITGIPRSASTLVFNICRLLLKQSETKYESYWINDIPIKLCFGKVFLIKIHDYDPLIAFLPLTFIHTTRDLKEVASSATIKGNGEPSIEHIKKLRTWDLKWHDKADIILNYSDLLDSNTSIKEIADILKVKDLSSEKIVEELESMKEPVGESYDKISQLHFKHRTDAGQKWKEVLSEKLIKEIDKLS